MRASETIILATNAAPGTYGPFVVIGGRYLAALACTGTPALQVYALDGAGNAIAVGATFVTPSGGSFEIALPPGQVEAIVGTSTVNTLTLSRIPGD